MSNLQENAYQETCARLESAISLMQGAETPVSEDKITATISAARRTRSALFSTVSPSEYRDLERQEAADTLKLVLRTLQLHWNVSTTPEAKAIINQFAQIIWGAFSEGLSTSQNSAVPTFSSLPKRQSPASSPASQSISPSPNSLSGNSSPVSGGHVSHTSPIIVAGAPQGMMQPMMYQQPIQRSSLPVQSAPAQNREVNTQHVTRRGSACSVTKIVSEPSTPLSVHSPYSPQQPSTTAFTETVNTSQRAPPRKPSVGSQVPLPQVNSVASSRVPLHPSVYASQAVPLPFNLCQSTSYNYNDDEYGERPSLPPSKMNSGMQYHQQQFYPPQTNPTMGMYVQHTDYDEADMYGS